MEINYGGGVRRLELSVSLLGTARAAITSITPSDGSMLTRSSQTFSWTGTPNILEYWIWVGTTKGARDILTSGSLGTATSTTVNGLPTDGSTVYLRLWHREEGGWLWTPFTYTAFTAGGTALQKSVVVVDANGTVVAPVSGGFGGGGGYVTIAFQVDSFVVAVVVRPDRMVIGPPFDALWESNDCMGAPVMNVNQSVGFAGLMFSPAMLVAQLNPGQDFLGKVRVADPNDVTPELVTIHSTIASGIPAGCIDLDLSQDSFQATVVDTLEIMDLDALFTPPFHVEMQ